ncbi:MAG TPA: hypothetical protein VGJ12_15920 [Gemmatimonadaceae bacterium]
MLLALSAAIASTDREERQALESGPAVIARIVIAIIALSVAALCTFAFMRVFARIAAEATQAKSARVPVRTAGWHLLHTPTRVLLREYHIARPAGTLGRYLSLFYIMGGAAAIIFFADVWSLFRR